MAPYVASFQFGIFGLLSSKLLGKNPSGPGIRTQDIRIMILGLSLTNLALSDILKNSLT